MFNTVILYHNTINDDYIWYKIWFLDIRLEYQLVCRCTWVLVFELTVASASWCMLHI